MEIVVAIWSDGMAEWTQIGGTVAKKLTEAVERKSVCALSVLKLIELNKNLVQKTKKNQKKTNKPKQNQRKNKERKQNQRKNVVLYMSMCLI